MFKIKNNKGFTLLELIAVMTVLGILVLLAAPKYIGYTQRVKEVEIKVNIVQLETANERYFMDEHTYAKLSAYSFSGTDLQSFAGKIIDKNGQNVEINESSEFFQFDFNLLRHYIQKPENFRQYFFEKQTRETFYIDELTNIGMNAIKTTP